MPQILRLCDSCKFYNESNDSCKAFPEGIPLRSSDPHFEVLDGQVGETIYDMDPQKYDLFEMHRRVQPQIRFPIILTYDIPEQGEGVSQQDVGT